MARIEIDPNYNSPTFSRATAAADIFKKEDVQSVAAALSTHVHDGAGKGLPVTFTGVPAGSIPGTALADGGVTSAKIADGTIATVDIANGAVTNAKLASDTARGNLLTNGGLEIWQRGNGPFTTASTFAADRWAINLGAGDTMSVSRDSANADVPSQYCAAVTYTRSTGGSLLDNTLTEQWQQLKGRTITLSVRVKTSSANAVRLRIYDNTLGARFGSYHSGGGSYETLTLTATVASSGVTLFTVDVVFDASCTAYVDNAMLVVGSQFADYAPLHPADDLARCQRYYEVVTETNTLYFVSGQAYSATAWLGVLGFQTKAVAPTVTLSAPSTFSVLNAAGAPIACTAVTGPSTSVKLTNLGATVASGLVAGNAATLIATGGQTATITFEGNP